MKISFVLIVSLLLLTACSTAIPQPTRTLSEPTASAVCRRPFRDAIDWTGVTWPSEAGSTTTTEWKEMMFAVVPQATEAGEAFLNNCVDPVRPLSEQRDHLNDMAELATLIWPPDTLPPDRSEYSPQVQLVNLDADDADELILMTRALGASDWGDFCVVYDLRENSDTWHGTLVWPSVADDYSLFSWPRNEPVIRPLSIAGTEDQALVLVEGDFGGADHTAKHLWAWQWGDNHLEIALKIRLSDWCGLEWHNWEVTEEGILVQATDATLRCEAREATLYYLKDGLFTSRTP